MPKITMSTKEILAFKPCKAGWNRLLRGLGKTEADDEQIPFIKFLETNSIEHVFWAMRVKWFEHKEIWMEIVNRAVSRAQDAADAAYADAYAHAADAAASAAYASDAAAYASEADADAAASASEAAAAAAYAAAYAYAYAAASEIEKQKQDIIELCS